MNNLPEVIENEIFSYLDPCKSNDICDYHLVSKLWNKRFNNKCYKIKVFNRIICGHHNEKIINMIRNSLFYTY